MAIVPVARPYRIGLPHYARNRATVHGLHFAQAAAAVNMCSGRRKKVHAQQWIKPSNMTTSATARTVSRGYLRTSPDVLEVRCRMMVAPTAASLTVPGTAIWTVNGVAQSTINLPGIVTSKGTDPETWFVVDQVFVDGSGDPLAGNTAMEFSLALDDGARVFGWTVYETQFTELDTASHQAVLVDPFGDGADILDRDLSDLVETMYTLWKQQAGVQIFWSVADATAITQNSTTYKNVLDAATTGWASTAAGFYVHPYKRGTLTSSSDPVTLWAIANTSAGTGNVRFTTSAGTLGTISSIGTTLQAYTTTADLNSANTSDLVVVEVNNNAANTTSFYACGMIEYSA